MSSGADAGWAPGRRNAVTDVSGVRVGHWTDRRRATGCTVILCPEAQAAAVDVRGGAPGTRETEVLAAANLVRTCHAILLAGGSAFGLAAATGVMRWLREAGAGFETRAGRVPIVPGAVIFDLTVGDPAAFPDEAAGYAAAAAGKGGRVAEGNVGAGAGATVAKLLGLEGRLKGGLGSASLVSSEGIAVGALAVVNATGAIADPESGKVVAGLRGEPGQFVPVLEAVGRAPAGVPALMENTTLVCVATDAQVEHRQLQRLAIHAHDGIARAIQPAHTYGDGDTTFVVTTGARPLPADRQIGLAVATETVVSRAIVRAVLAARPSHGVPSVSSWRA